MLGGVEVGTVQACRNSSISDRLRCVPRLVLDKSSFNFDGKRRPEVVAAFKAHFDMAMHCIQKAQGSLSTITSVELQAYKILESAAHEMRNIAFDG